MKYLTLFLSGILIKDLIIFFLLEVKKCFHINFSGPILYLIGKFLYFFKSKSNFISCDGLDYLYRETNSINLWMGGTTTKYLKI